MEVVAFVPAETIDPIRIAAGYCLTADGQVAAKPYILLWKALERSEKAAIAKFAWHGRALLGMLQALEDAIVLHAMRWPDEIRPSETLASEQVDLDEDGIDRALALMDTLAEDDATGYTDRYREALEEVIAAKAEGRDLPEAGREPGGRATVVDLMAALESSVQAAKEARSQGGEPGTVQDMPKKRAKKAAAKKTSGRKPRSA
ncbi:Ku protein [Streptomyces sp. NPDC004609]|uniref:Ku protein n=1 Tax=Streptomyces sp. NPDC004609 TaxID=3364704 RepID=UPI003688D5A2